MFQPYSFTTPQVPKSTHIQPNPDQLVKSSSPPARAPTPFPEPETYKDWDEIVKKFLQNSKLHGALKGLENDILALSPDWEQKAIPEALNDMVIGLQVILDRVSSRQSANADSMEAEPEVDITTTTDSLGGRPLEERKMDYAHLSLGVERSSPSSINKSISQFLSRTRARNDASNRSEFLYTLSEKKRKLAQSQAESEELRNVVDQNGHEREVVSCARADAKPIDRDKQVKYDIAKYGEGPLTKTVKPSQESAPQPVSTVQRAEPDLSEVSATSALRVPLSNGSDVAPHSKRKRKLDEMNGIEQSQIGVQPCLMRKGKGTMKDDQQNGQPSVPCVGFELDSEETALALATAPRHPGLDERLKNLEEHLAIRYVPNPPRTLMARLKFLEDHVIKLEKEYPPWAALHFNQPHRGWPPPPRATPVIVPPHLRTVASSSSAPSTANSNPASTNVTPTSNTPASSVTGLTAVTSTNVRPRKAGSSLHKAVLERLEVQRAMNEMGGKSSRAD
ncbi:hypothetical protein CPB84DRAFT_1782859 [Gymnopilus junonius]|uniref:Uncharacterized protein n=1 Tax=Gymnopilus junonius TaxID=109634 RepID=A0A9P5TKR2_GYMJU|nr:hypothetical protein CPB84DRAFT_1782859 [Gymnopilus junonius]